jgi:hypothetical protein
MTSPTYHFIVVKKSPYAEFPYLVQAMVTTPAGSEDLVELAKTEDPEHAVTLAGVLAEQHRVAVHVLPSVPQTSIFETRPRSGAEPPRVDPGVPGLDPTRSGLVLGSGDRYALLNGSGEGGYA